MGLIPNFLWQRATFVTGECFADRVWKNHKKWCNYCVILYSTDIIYKRSHCPHNATRRAAGWTPMM